MKTLLKNILVASLAFFAFAACSKNDEPQNHTTFDLNIDSPFTNEDASTKVAYKKSFDEGDWLFIVFGTSASDNYDYKNTLKLRYYGGKWKPASTAEQQRLDNLAEGSGYIHAVSNCFNGTASKTSLLDTCFRMDNVKMMLYSRTPGTYKKENGKITGNVKISPLDEIQLNLTDMDYSITPDRGSYNLSIHYNNSNFRAEFYKRTGGYFNSKGFTWTKDPNHTSVLTPFDSGSPTEASYFFSISDVYLEKSTVNSSTITVNEQTLPVYTLNGVSLSLYIYSQTLGRAIFATHDGIGTAVFQPYAVHEIKGPKLSKMEIETKNIGDDLGNGWRFGSYTDLHD